MATPNNTYELVYIISGVLSDDQTQSLVARVRRFLEENDAEIIEHEEWGSRRLAYTINKKRTGYYVDVHFRAAGDLVPRLERALEIEDDILRYLTLKLDAKMLRAFENRTQDGEEAPSAGDPSKINLRDYPEYISFTQTDLLKRHTNEQGKILPRRVMNVPAKTQRQVTRAIKRARHLAMLPFVADTIR